MQVIQQEHQRTQLRGVAQQRRDRLEQAELLLLGAEARRPVGGAWVLELRHDRGELRAPRADLHGAAHRAGFSRRCSDAAPRRTAGRGRSSLLVAAPASTVAPSLVAPSGRTPSPSRVLPIPGSPTSTTTRRPRSRTAAHSLANVAAASERPTNAPRSAPATSGGSGTRSSVEGSHTISQAAVGSGDSLQGNGPSARKANPPRVPTSARTSSEARIWPPRRRRKAAWRSPRAYRSSRPRRGSAHPRSGPCAPERGSPAWRRCVGGPPAGSRSRSRRRRPRWERDHQPVAEVLHLLAAVHRRHVAQQPEVHASQALGLIIAQLGQQSRSSRPRSVNSSVTIAGRRRRLRSGRRPRRRLTRRGRAGARLAAAAHSSASARVACDGARSAARREAAASRQ